VFRSLITNTLISGFAFVVSALVPLLLVPLLIGSFGIVQYGIIVITRILLPTGTFAIFDFGNSEIATQAMAQARHDDDWLRAGRTLRCLGKYTLITGLVVGLALFAGAHFLGELLNVPPEYQESFARIVIATSLAFPLLLTATIGEGILKGLEAFRRFRTVDVSNAALYGLLALAIIWRGLPFAWVALAYIFTMTLRAAVILTIALRMLRQRGVRFLVARPEERADVRRRSLAMAGNRVLSATQAQGAPMLISALLSPSAVGLYDVITRVPRFFKSVTGLMNAAVLPLSARLDAANDEAGMRRLGELGLLAVSIATAPICAWCVVFSEPLLRLWIDAHFASFWVWQAIMFIVPLANAMTSFGGGALLSRTHVVKQLNLVALVQIVLQFALALTCMRWFDERAFILGQCVAVLVTFPVQMYIIAREKQLGLPAFRRIFAMVASLCAATAAGLAFHFGSFVQSPVTLIASFALWLGATALLIWLALLHASERRAILGMLSSITGTR